jgi:hypothetical protein
LADFVTNADPASRLSLADCSLQTARANTLVFVAESPATDPDFAQWLKEQVLARFFAEVHEHRIRQLMHTEIAGFTVGGSRSITEIQGESKRKPWYF